MLLSRLLLLSALLSFRLSFAGSITTVKANVYVISIGINNYKAPFASLKNAVNDAQMLANKIRLDNNAQAQFEQSTEQINSIRSLHGIKPTVNLNYQVDSVYTYLILDEKASIENIKNAFRDVASKARTEDYFIFYFGGFSREISLSETVIVPFMQDPFPRIEDDPFALPTDKVISLKTIALLMEQIACDKQLVISEAGDGSSFARNLIASFFESNPLLSAGTSRNRIILTTTSFGWDQLRCKDSTYNNAPLAHYLLQSSNILDVFHKNYTFQYELMGQDIACFNQKKYIACYVEKEYQKMFIPPVKIASRGIDVQEEETVEKDEHAPKTFALVIGTNTYGRQSDWKNLKNPINDANAVAELLERKYGAEVKMLYDEPKDSVFFNIVKLKNEMQENDKFILFIAGHGYFSKELTDGFLVMNNSKAINKDTYLESYMQMASLNRLIDNIPAKNVFVIFDVCFGATFDLNAQDIDPNRYQNTDLDISIAEFIDRQNEKTSRIFLASGRYEVPDYWSNSLNHSPFADKLINFLSSEDVFVSPGKLMTIMEGNATAPILKQFGKHQAGADFLLPVK